MKKSGKHIQKLLFSKELRLLAGKNYRNVSTLFIVNFLSLMAISVAWTSHEFLKSRMLDPYTNWLNIPMLFSEDATANMRDSITLFLSDEAVFQEMGIASASRNFATSFRIGSVDGSFDRMLYGETFHSQTDSLLLQKVLNVESLNQEDFSRGIILSETSMKKLGSSTKKDYPSKVIIKINNYSGNFVYALPLNVIKVVEQLPERDEFIIHPELNYRLRQPNDQTRLLSFSKSYDAFKILSDVKPENVEVIQNNISLIDGVRSVTHEPFDANYPKKSLISIHVELENSMPFSDRYYFFENKIAPQFKNLNPVFMPLEEELYFNTYIDSEEQIPHNFVLNFAELKKIRHFSETMFNRFGYRVDLAALESKENFALTSLTTKLLAICLFLFSLSGILIFVGTLLLSHLHGIAQNIGTMKAFGLSSKSLNNNYLKISFVLITSVIIASLFLLWLMQITFADSLFNWMISEGATNLLQNGFTPFNTWTITASLLILAGTVIITKIVSNKVLRHAPGDLIYRRK
jgi:hypothetical protein